MSANDKTVSDAAHDVRTQDFVLDFLYHDARRVASFLAQFDPSGHLTGLKQSENVSRTEGEDGNVQATANALVARASGSFVLRRGSSAGEASERTYDPFWTNARTFLDFLSEHNLINRDIREARIGQFVLVTGTLMIADLSILKIIWDNPSLRSSNFESDLKSISLPADASEETREAAIRDIQFAYDLLPGLPHTLQARLINQYAGVWCGLSDDALVGSAADITLKHGAVLGGYWNMIGILDALPYNPNPVSDDGRPFIDIIAEAAGEGGGRQALRLAQIARNLMGRPAQFYGITPLLIYRQIEAAT